MSASHSEQTLTMQYPYLRDPLFLVSLVLYCANRWIAKPWFPNTISRCYFNDLICIPFWVPIMLFVMRVLKLRPATAPPQWHEILIPLLLWSVVFELIAPQTHMFRGIAFTDYADILCYASGALIAALFWRRYTEPGREQTGQTTGASPTI